ncbi:hypothetical protein HA402_011329 [Bradysia odoriphaga]|nr:hypothetical protein HA402_011329 [Bradysia odoriphaga]
MDVDTLLLESESYEDYLDAFVQPKDLFYLRDPRLARQIVTLGYRSAIDVLTLKQYNARRNELLETLSTTRDPHILFSINCRATDVMVLELAERERANRLGMLTTIISMRYRQSNRVEISGFIDFEESLRKSITNDSEATDWTAIFNETKTLRLKKTDLGYYNWHTGFSIMNDSTNFKAVADPVRGLFFECRHDRKPIYVDPFGDVGSGSTRTVVKSSYFSHVVLFDHVIRSKT